MTDATFRTRSVRALAVAGVIGLVASPVLAPRAYAARGDIKVAPVGQTPGNSNDPHITGCDFQVIANNFDKGTFKVSFTTQDPKPSGVSDKDFGFSGPGTFVIPSDGEAVSNNFTLFSTTGKTLPKAKYHIKVQLSGDGEKVNSKVFWLDDCTAAPPTVPGPEPSSQPSSEPSARPTASVPGKVNSGLEADSSGGIIALGVGGVAIAGLGALGLRRRGR